MGPVISDFSINSKKNNIYNGKTIALIGSSKELELNDYSDVFSTVDFDIVARVNCVLNKNLDSLDIPDNVINHTTHRTDIMYHAGSQTNEDYSFFSEYINVCKKNNIKHIIITEHSRYKGICKKFQQSGKMILKLHNRLKNHTNGTWHTAGVKAILDILKFNPKKLYIFGMDLHLSY